MLDAWGEVVEPGNYPADNQPRIDADGRVVVRVWIYRSTVWHRGWRCAGPGTRWEIDSPEVRAVHPDGVEAWVATHEAFGARADGD